MKNTITVRKKTLPVIPTVPVRPLSIRKTTLPEQPALSYGLWCEQVGFGTQYSTKLVPMIKKIYDKNKVTPMAEIVRSAKVSNRGVNIKKFLM